MCHTGQSGSVCILEFMVKVEFTIHKKKTNGACNLGVPALYRAEP